MNHQSERFSQRLDQFFQTHHKEFYPEDRLVVIELYDELASLLEDEADLTMTDGETSMDITITAHNFLSSRDFSALQDLIHEATVFDARILDNQILFQLHFDFWEYIPNT